ncbi:MAG: BCD family MFS transporter [Pseudomonadota bacterium]
MFRAIKTSLWTLKIALPKVAVGWMFALLTIDFNRVAIVELGVAAIVVTTLLSIHYLFAPFQVIAGRIADKHPLWGFRRTPYLLAASLIASLLFLLLPGVTLAMESGGPLALFNAVILFACFGICMAVTADSYHSLIAENTKKEHRAAIIAVVWIVMILSTILSAVVMNAVRPEFTPEAMQRLYNLTPLVVLGAVLIGVVGFEKRLNPQEIQKARARALAITPPGNPLRASMRLLQSNRQAGLFFTFVGCAIFALFLQESLLEVLGAEVFDASIQDTTRYQPTWGGGILLGMIVMGCLSSIWRVPKETLTLIGCATAALGFLLLATVALFRLEQMLIPTLFCMGICAGIFNVGALAIMMEMTVEGATGLYMGLWGVAQAIGMGTSSIVAGGLHTALIGSGFIQANSAYGLIFSLEGGLLLAAAFLFSKVNIDQFQRLASGLNDNDNGSGKDDENDRNILDVATAGA